MTLTVDFCCCQLTGNSETPSHCMSSTKLLTVVSYYFKLNYACQCMHKLQRKLRQIDGFRFASCMRQCRWSLRRIHVHDGDFKSD